MRFALIMIAVAATLSCSTDRRRGFDERETFPASSAVEARHEASPSRAPATQDSPWILIDLPGVLALAGANDLAIAAARKRVDELEAREDLARYRFFPSLYPVASFRRLTGEFQASRGNFVDVTRQQTLGGVQARLELELGDAIYGLDAARSMSSAGRYQAEETRNVRLRDAAQRYYDLVAAVQRMEIGREAIRSADELLAFHRSRVRSGAGLQLDVERARARLEAENTAFARAERDFRRVAVDLAVQLRLDPRVTLYPADETLEPVPFIERDADVENLVVAALAGNPGILASGRELLAHDARLDGAHNAWLIPKVFVEGSIDARGDAPGTLDDTEELFVGIEWELSLGQGARERIARARRDQAAMSLARLRERIVAEVVGVWDQIRLDRRRIESAERRITAAQAAFGHAESRLRAGAGLAIEVLDAQVDVTEARISRLDAIRDYNSAQVTLLVLTGSEPSQSPSIDE